MGNRPERILGHTQGLRDIARPGNVNLQDQNILPVRGFWKVRVYSFHYPGDGFQTISHLASSFIMVLLAPRACPLMML